MMDTSPKEFVAEIPPQRMFVPGLYRHYKGGHYLALMLVQDSTDRDGKPSTEAPMVLYINLEPGQRSGNKCVRDLRQWIEWVNPKTGVAVPPNEVNAGVHVRRFTILEERK